MYCTKDRTLWRTIFCDVRMFVPWQLCLQHVTDWLFLKEEQGKCIQAGPLKKTVLVLCLKLETESASETFQHWANILTLWYQTTLTFDSEPVVDILVLTFFCIHISTEEIIEMRDLRSSQQCYWRFKPSVILCCVAG